MFGQMYRDKLEKLQEEYGSTQKIFIERLLSFVGELIDVLVSIYKQNIVLQKRVKALERKLK